MSLTTYSNAACRVAPFASPRATLRNNPTFVHRESYQCTIGLEESSNWPEREEVSHHADRKSKPISFQTVSLQQHPEFPQHAAKLRFFRQRTHELEEDETYREEEWSHLTLACENVVDPFPQTEVAAHIWESNLRRPTSKQSVESLVRFFKSRLSLYNELLVSLELLYLECVDGDNVEGAREVAGFIEAVKGRQEILGARLLETDITLGQMCNEKPPWQSSHPIRKSLNILHGGNASTTTSSSKLEPSNIEKCVHGLKELPKNDSPRRLSSNAELPHRCMPPLRWRSMFSFKSKFSNRRLSDDEWSGEAAHPVS